MHRVKCFESVCENVTAHLFLLFLWQTLLEDQNQGYVDLDRFQEEIYSTLHKSSDEKV